MSQETQNIDISLLGLDNVMVLGNHQIKVFAFDAERGVEDVHIDIQIVSGHASIMQNSPAFGFLPVTDYSTRTNHEGETYFNLNLGQIGEVELRLVWKDPSYKRTWQRPMTFVVKEKHFLDTQMLFAKRDLKCVVEAPEERDSGGFATVRVKVTDNGKPAKSMTVALETSSPNAVIFRTSELDEKQAINTGLTDSNGFAVFQVEHAGNASEEVTISVLWDADGEQRKEDRVIRFKGKEDIAMTDDKEKQDKEDGAEQEQKQEGNGSKPSVFRQQWKAFVIIGAAVIVVLAVVGIDYGTDHSIGNWLTGWFGAKATEVAAGPVEAVVPENTDMVFSESEAAKLDQPPKDVEPPASLLAGLVDEDENSDSDDDPTDVPPAQDQPEEAPGLVSVNISENDGSVEILHPKMWNTLQSVEDLEAEVQSLELDNAELEKQNSDMADNIKDLKKELGKPKYVMPKRLDCRDSEWELKPGGVIRLYDCKILEVGKKKKKK